MSDFEYQTSSHYRPPETWTLTLNRYQRDNLLWLLQVVGGWPDQDAAAQRVEPFTFANNGDWLGEIAGMLGTEHWHDGKRVTTYAPRRPNVSAEQLREQVAQWLANQ